MLRTNLFGIPGCALRVALVATAILLNSPLAAQEAKPEAEKGDAGRRPAFAQRHLRKALESPTTLEFIETPLKDVVDYLKDLHGIEIQIDQRALDGVGVSSDTPVTRNLKGVSLRSALTLMLRELELTYCIQHEVIQITTRDAVDSHVIVQTYSAADIADDEAAATALTKVVEMALDPPVEPAEGVKPLSPGPRVVMLRGLLVVRVNPREQERIEELLSNIRRKLKLPDLQAAHLLEGWKPGERVALAGLPLEPGDLAPLKDQLQVKHFDLANTRLRDPDAAHLTGLTNLETLAISGNQLTDETCRHLAGLVKLRTLDVSGNKISDVGLARLKDLHELRHLTLSRTQIGDAGLAHLAGMSQLQTLDLAGTKITSKGLAQLKPLSQLESLSLASMAIESLRDLPVLPQLRELDLSNTPIHEGNLERLTKFGNLRVLNLQNVELSEMGLLQLAEFKQLESLTLGGNRHKQISAEHAQKLRNTLSRCRITVHNITPSEGEERDPFGP